MKYLLLFILFMGTSIAKAEVTREFACKVMSVHAISENGEIVNDTEHLKSQIGSTFRVERKTGYLKSKNRFLFSEGKENIDVINQPESNSYYVVYKSYGPYKMVGYLYIADHRKWNKKPFTYTNAGEYIYSGYCLNE